MNTKTIFLLRHGETDFNKHGMVQGRGVDASLNNTGRWQGERASSYLEKQNLDALFTSTLRRTKETIEPLLGNEIEHFQHEGFDEISWGKYEGIKADSEARENYWKIITGWRAGELAVSIGGGETPLEVMERQQQGMEVLLNTPGERIAVCMHGRAMRILLCWLLNYPLQYMDQFPHQNCSIYQLSYSGKIFHLNRFNYLDHLSG